jgi:ankyrin repeat protein
VDARQSTYGRTALIGAVVGGHPAVVQTLLGAGADRSIAEQGGITALAAARELRHHSMVKMLQQ